MCCLKIPVTVVRMSPFNFLESLSGRDVDFGLLAVGLVVRARHHVVDVVHGDGLVGVRRPVCPYRMNKIRLM